MPRNKTPNVVDLSFQESYTKPILLTNHWVLDKPAGKIKGWVATKLHNLMVKWGWLKQPWGEETCYRKVSIPEGPLWKMVEGAVDAAANQLRAEPESLYIGRSDFFQLLKEDESFGIGAFHFEIEREKCQTVSADEMQKRLHHAPELTADHFFEPALRGAPGRIYEQWNSSAGKTERYLERRTFMGLKVYVVPYMKGFLVV